MLKIDKFSAEGADGFAPNVRVGHSNSGQVAQSGAEYSMGVLATSVIVMIGVIWSKRVRGIFDCKDECICKKTDIITKL